MADRDRHFAEMRAALNAARLRFCQATVIQATAHSADGIRCGLPQRVHESLVSDGARSITGFLQEA